MITVNFQGTLEEFWAIYRLEPNAAPAVLKEPAETDAFGNHLPREADVALGVLRELASCQHSNNKIAMIKIVRQMTFCDLATAKNLVERIAKNFGGQW